MSEGAECQLFPICVAQTLPPWDGLPVGKMVAFGQKVLPNDFVYSQVQLCYVPHQGLFVRLWSFETTPGDDRFLALHLAFNKKPWVISPKNNPPGTALFYGEDQQGIYWGGQFLVEQALLPAVFTIGDQLLGNVQNHARADGFLFPETQGVFAFISF